MSTTPFTPDRAYLRKVYVGQMDAYRDTSDELRTDLGSEFDRGMQAIDADLDRLRDGIKALIEKYGDHERPRSVHRFNVEADLRALLDETDTR